MVFSTPANLRTPFCISSKKHHLKKTALSGQEGPGGRTGIGEEHKGVVSEHWDSSKVILLSKFRWPAIFWPFLVGGWTKPLWKIRERQNGFIDLSPIFRCENKKCLSCHHLAIIPKLELFGHFEDIPILNHHLGWLLGGSDFPGDPSSPPSSAARSRRCSSIKRCAMAVGWPSFPTAETQEHWLLRRGSLLIFFKFGMLFFGWFSEMILKYFSTVDIYIQSNVSDWPHLGFAQLHTNRMKPMLTRPYQQRTIILQPCNQKPNSTSWVVEFSRGRKKTVYVVGIWPLQLEKPVNKSCPSSTIQQVSLCFQKTTIGIHVTQILHVAKKVTENNPLLDLHWRG